MMGKGWLLDCCGLQIRHFVVVFLVVQLQVLLFGLLGLLGCGGHDTYLGEGGCPASYGKLNVTRGQQSIAYYYRAVLKYGD